ncbi:MAG: hypothetical protein JO316_21900 [Abitibacteriaceae bacterium]|nr:hypothetical protein [Abditibacteriaceae bacterium]
MPFIKYTETGRSFAPKVSINRTGLISFSDGARKRFNLDAYQFCVLYYEPETYRIGIELTNDGKAEGIKRLRLRSTGADIAAKSFVDFFALPLKGTTICDLSKDEDSGLLTFDLSRGKVRGSIEEPTKDKEDDTSQPLDET